MLAPDSQTCINTALQSKIQCRDSGCAISRLQHVSVKAERRHVQTPSEYSALALMDPFRAKSFRNPWMVWQVARFFRADMLCLAFTAAWSALRSTGFKFRRCWWLLCIRPDLQVSGCAAPLCINLSHCCQLNHTTIKIPSWRETVSTSANPSCTGGHAWRTFWTPHRLHAERKRHLVLIAHLWHS